MSLAEIRSRLLDLMREEKALYDSLLKKVVALGERAFAPERGGRERLPRTAPSNILAQPGSRTSSACGRSSGPSRRRGGW